MLTEKDIDALVNKALTGKHNKLPQIYNIHDLRAARTVLRAVNKIVKAFNRIKVRAFNDYVQSRNTHQTESTQVSHLLNVRLMRRCATFYQAEADNISVLIKDYNKYRCMSISNLINSYRGQPRMDVDYEEIIKQEEKDDFTDIFTEFKDKK